MSTSNNNNNHTDNMPPLQQHGGAKFFRPGGSLLGSGPLPNMEDNFHVTRRVLETNSSQHPRAAAIAANDGLSQPWLQSPFGTAGEEDDAFNVQSEASKRAASPASQFALNPARSTLEVDNNEQARATATIADGGVPSTAMSLLPLSASHVVDATDSASQALEPSSTSSDSGVLDEIESDASQPRGVQIPITYTIDELTSLDPGSGSYSTTPGAAARLDDIPESLGIGEQEDTAPEMDTQSLPTFEDFTNSLAGAQRAIIGAEDDAACAVCMHEWNYDTTIPLRLTCKHLICRECAGHWFQEVAGSDGPQRTNSCPHCRTKLFASEQQRRGDSNVILLHANPEEDVDFPEFIENQSLLFQSGDVAPAVSYMAYEHDVHVERKRDELLTEVMTGVETHMAMELLMEMYEDMYLDNAAFSYGSAAPGFMGGEHILRHPACAYALQQIYLKLQRMTEFKSLAEYEDETFLDLQEAIVALGSPGWRLKQLLEDAVADMLTKLVNVVYLRRLWGRPMMGISVRDYEQSADSYDCPDVLIRWRQEPLELEIGRLSLEHSMLGPQD